MISADDVARSRFTPTKFRAGYNQRDVDAVLAKSRDALAFYERSGSGTAPFTADAVVNARFQPTSFRAGYDQTEVDDLLDQIVAALRSYEANRLSPS